MKLYIDESPKPKSISRVNGKPKKKNALEEIGVDPGLLKSMRTLDFGKLIKRAVQVHGKSGKTFTRMQWVSPEEASTGHGMRKINSLRQLNMAKRDGIDKHPQYHEALKEQGVDLNEHDWDKHPHFYLPETEESKDKVTNDSKRYHTHEDESGAHRSKSGVVHVPHGVKDPDHKVYDEDHFTRPPENPMPRYFNEVNSLDDLKDPGKSPYDRMHAIHAVILDHWDDIRSEIKGHIDDDPDSDEVAKRIQNQTLNKVHEDQPMFSVMCSHPQVLSHALEHCFGSRKLDELRMETIINNLTINTSHEALPSILSNGYRAMDVPSYMKSKDGTVLSDEDFDFYDNLVKDNRSTPAILSDIEDHAVGLYRSRSPKRYKVWSNIHRRAKAEYDALGLKFSDPKPVYIAYNPNGSKKGGAPMYGDGAVIKVDDKILKNCTANMGDTFYTSDGIPKVHDFSHLADMFIMRHLQQYVGDTFERGNWIFTQDNMYDDVPIEMQYHKGVLEPENMSVYYSHENHEINSDEDTPEWDNEYADDDDVNLDSNDSGEDEWNDLMKDWDEDDLEDDLDNPDWDIDDKPEGDGLDDLMGFINNKKKG